MIYNHIIKDDFYRLEEDVIFPVEWLKLNGRKAQSLGLFRMANYNGYYEGTLLLPKGTIVQIYTNGFRVIRSLMGRVIKQISLYNSSFVFNLKYLDGKEIIHLIHNDDIFESQP